MEKFGLAIHTSSSDLGLAISDFANESRSNVWGLGREVSNLLQLYLADFIQPQVWQDLGFIAVCKGPGSFTGTRIGVVTSRILAQQLDLPLFTISSLAAIANSQQSSGTYIIQLPAHSNKLYVGIYKVDKELKTIHNLMADQTVDRQYWQEKLTSFSNEYQVIETDDHLGNGVTDILALAHQQWSMGMIPHWSEGLPFYGE
jgi:tRNA threonylcarbamoyl adenosine modification protein YeaZ